MLIRNIVVGFIFYKMSDQVVRPSNIYIYLNAVFCMYALKE